LKKEGSRKTVRTLAFASFFNDLGSDMIHPVWPLFLTSVLGVNMSILGLIDGLGDALVSISQAASGYLSDRTKKRKFFIWLGYAFPLIARVGYGLSTAWQHIIPFKMLDRAGKIRSAPRDAIIADVSSKENRGSNFGFRKMMDNLGAVCGIVACLVLFPLLGFRNLFFLAAVPSIIAAGLVFLLIREKKSETRIYEGLSFRDLDRNFRLFLLSSSFFALGAFSYSFLLIFATHSGFKMASIPLMYLIFTAAASLSSLPFGKISDRIGRKPVMILSLILWGLVCLVLILSQDRWAIILAFILYGFHKGAFETVQTTYASELCPPEYRASSLGGLKMVVGLCALPASVVAGILWDQINLFAPFFLSLVLTAFSMILLLFIGDGHAEAEGRSATFQ
jgi:MFS family permease